MPPLCATVETGQIELMRLLLERGCNVNDSIGCNGMTPFIYIYKCICMYLCVYVYIHYITYIYTLLGMTPLFLAAQAAQEGFEEMCKVFIANGADVEIASI
jgi:ankyrin repeat protein